MTHGEWQMIMRSPGGDDYPIGSGHLPATVLPDPAHDDNVIVTIELAQFIRGIGDKIEHLCTQGEVTGFSVTHKATDIEVNPLPDTP